MEFFKMITFQSSKNGSMSDIPISAIEAEIKRECVPDEAKALIRKFHVMNFGSTITKVAGEVAVYHRDAAAIFSLLKVPVKFIDVNGKELAVDGSGSGIYF
jgi:hypothetical protein